MVIFLKWILFLTIGLLGQLVVYLLYPWLVLYWILFVYHAPIQKNEVRHDFNIPEIIGNKTKANGLLLDNSDDHGAFTQYGFIQKEGLELLQRDGALIRTYNSEQMSESQEQVSGDVVVSWFFANTLAERKVSDQILKKVVDHYILNLGTISKDKKGNEYVSNRCSNFGVNYAPDSDFLGISQPAVGPQYYTTAAVLAAGYHLGFRYKIAYWSHFIIMGGWYWAWVPMIYPDNDTWWYVRDITMKSLYVQLQVFGPKWWITKPMEFINDKTTISNNDLFNAMMKRPIKPLPKVMDAFFSQRPDSRSGLSDRMSSYIPNAILKIQIESKYQPSDFNVKDSVSTTD